MKVPSHSISSTDSKSNHNTGRNILLNCIARQAIFFRGQALQRMHEARSHFQLVDFSLLSWDATIRAAEGMLALLMEREDQQRRIRVQLRALSRALRSYQTTVREAFLAELLTERETLRSRALLDRADIMLTRGAIVVLRLHR